MFIFSQLSHQAFLAFIWMQKLDIKGNPTIHVAFLLVFGFCLFVLVFGMQEVGGKSRI